MGSSYYGKEGYMGSSMSQQGVSQRSQQLMVFILVMALAGLENLIAEIIPELEIGLVEVGISSFYFVPLVLVIIFNSWAAAFAAPIGEIVFSDLLLGEFGGLGELEEVLLVGVSLYIAGRLVRDLTNRRQVAIAALLGFVLAEFFATVIDILKVWIGVEELEAVAGLPQSIVVLEFIDFGVEFVITGLLFGLIPTLYFVPRLYRKIEPLLGMKPRPQPDTETSGVPVAVWFIMLIAIGGATLFAILSEMGINLVEWEPEFLEVYGDGFIWLAIAASAVAVGVVLLIAQRIFRNRKQSEA